MELILSGDNINEGRIKINSLSGFSSYWSAGTGTYSIIGNDLTGNTASNDYSFVGGFESVSSGNTSFAFGQNVIAGGDFSVAFGRNSKSIGDFTYTSGEITTAIGNNSFVSNNRSAALGDFSIALNNLTTSVGSGSTSLNYINNAYGDYSFVSGVNSNIGIVGHHSFISSSNSNISGERSALLGGQSMTLADDDVVYVSKLNINNINDDNSLKNVLTLESNGDVNQKEYDTNFINLTGEILTNTTVLEVNKFYSLFQINPTNENYLPTTGNTGDVIIVANLRDVNSPNFTEYITVNGTYNTSIFYGIGDSTGIEITNSISSSDQFELKRGTVIEFTYFGSDVGLNCWVVTKYDTIGKYINALDDATSTDDYDIEYIS